MSRPTRVVHVIQRLETGGLEAMALRLADAARRYGVESAVVAYEGVGDREAGFRAEGGGRCSSGARAPACRPGRP